MSIGKTTVGGAVIAITVSVLSVLAPMPAGAAQNHFTCRASALRLNLPLGQEVEPLTANPANDPCQQDFESVLSFGQDLGIVTGTLVAKTNDDPKQPNSSAKVEKLKLANLLDLVNLRAKSIRSRARITPTADGTCRLHSSSTLVKAVIDGKEYASLDTPLDVDVKLLGVVVAKLHLNATLGGENPTIGQPDPTKVTQRAIWLHVTDPVLQEVLADLVVGEASIGTVGTPCA